MANETSSVVPPAPKPAPAVAATANTIAGPSIVSPVQNMSNVAETTKEAPTQASENFRLVTNDLAQAQKTVLETRPAVTIAPTPEPTPAARADLTQRQQAQVTFENNEAATRGAMVASKITKETKLHGPEGTAAIVKQQAAAMEEARKPVQAAIVDTKPAVPANDPGAPGGTVDDIAAMPKSKGPSRRVGAFTASVAASTVSATPAPDAKFGNDASPVAAAAKSAAVVVTASRSEMAPARPVAKASGFLDMLGLGSGIRIPEPRAAAVFNENTAAPVAAIAFKPGQPIAGTNGASMFAGAEPEKVTINAGQKPQADAAPAARRAPAPVYGMGVNKT